MTIVGSVVVAGLATWMQTMEEIAQENQTFKDQGLTAEEVAAMRYYNASAADQATIAKRMGRIPSIADWKSAIAKLNAEPAGRNTSGGPDDRGGRSGKDSREDKTPKAIKLLEPRLERVRTAQTETKRETVKGAGLMSSTTRSASYSNAATISAAVRASRPVITTKVDVHVTGGTVKKVTNIQESYGPGSGSAGTGHAPGTGPLR